MTVFETSQPERPKVMEYFHNILVMPSGLFLVALATATIAILHFSPGNEYVAMEMDLTTRLDVLVYLSAGLILLGLLELVILAVLLLHCHDNKKQRTIVSICCLATTLLSLGILVLFAVQPTVLMDQVLPTNDALYEPINESYAVAMEAYGRQGNEELTQSMKRLQIEENCCHHDKCIIIKSDGEILRPTQSCVQHFYDYYSAWLQRSKFIIKITAIVFCAVLGISIITNIWLLISSTGLDHGRYTVEKRKSSKYRHNISSFTYVPFQSDMPRKESPQNAIDTEIFCIAKNDVKNISAFGPTVCVMHDY